MSRRGPRPAEVEAARNDPRLRRAMAERETGAQRARLHDSGWVLHGRCLTTDPETFFPEPRDSNESAIELCRGCSVQTLCLIRALDLRDDNGVWGATTPVERRAMGVVWRQRQPVSR